MTATSPGHACAATPPTPSTASTVKGSFERMALKYRFDDADMDFFFAVALGWSSEGGLSVGQAFHVASRIADGDAASWVRAFVDYGDDLVAQADAWAARGWTRQAAETRFTAFASYRSAWQFAAPGAPFLEIYAKERAAFRRALPDLALPATFFDVPYDGRALPGVFLRHADADAPVVLLVGGADTGFEDTFMSVGRGLWERGYSVAMVDLPGQGTTMADGLHWEAAAERPIGAVVDLLVDRFAARPGRIALMGYSLGGYFATQAAGREPRLGAVVASTPFHDPARLFAQQAAGARAAGSAPSTATQRNREVFFWKAGARNGAEFLERTAGMRADASLVTVPFLSIVGTGETPDMLAQAQEWRAGIRSARNDLVLLDAATGADGHCQVGHRRRLQQEVSGWLDEVFAR